MSRRPVLEMLEHRAMLAAYTFDNNVNALSIDLGTNESITISVSAGTVSLALSSGTFTPFDSDLAPGNGTNTLMISAADLATSLSINNATVADPGTNLVKFSGAGSLSTGTLTVTLTDPDATATIVFEAGFDVASTAGINLTAVRSITVGENSVISNSGDGGITMSANRQATPRAGTFSGITIEGEVTTSGDGDISLSGRGGTDGVAPTGVYLQVGGKVKSTKFGESAGKITVDGLGGVAGVILDQNSLIQSADGDITITGVGGSVMDASAFGVYIPNTGFVQSYGQSAHAAKITITGTAPNAPGIELRGAAGNISSENGAIELIGESSATGTGISFNGTTIISTANAPVSLVSDRMSLIGNIFAFTGVSLRGKTSGRPINLGGSDSTTELGLGNVELDRIGTLLLKIGDSSSGVVTVSHPRTSMGTDLVITSGSTIDVNQNLTLIDDPDADVTASGHLTLDAPTINVASGIALTATASNVSFQGGALNVGDSPGSLSIIGKLLLASSATHHAEITGLTPATDYDLIITTDQVKIDSATLDLDFSFTPAIGDGFLLIDNQSNSPTLGTFANLPQGAVLAEGGLVYQITYTHGPGSNDVLVTRIAAPASTLVVDNTGDVSDGNFGLGQLTLREAMLLANVLSDQNTITFDATVFAGATTITLSNGELPKIVKPVDIIGPGADRLTIDADGQSRHLQIASEAVIVSLSGMTFFNGFTDDLPGGSIENNSNLILFAMAFEQNVIDGAPGGAIANAGSMIVNDSAFIANRADIGGAIYNTGILRVFNTTISGNSAIDLGGGVADLAGDVCSFVNSTIVGNFAGNEGGGVYSDATITLDNTIVAGNTHIANVPSDLNGVASGFNNLIGDADSVGGLTDSDNGNIVGINGVGTRPLDTIVEVTPAFNGGPTKTHKLMANSKAIDAGRNDAAINAGDGPLQFDQRGTPFDRIVNDVVDIGAYELAVPPISGDGNVTATVTKGKLRIVGDSEGNAFRVTQVDGDSYRIEGIDQTTINGQAFVVMDRVLKDWNIDLGPGADTLLMGAADSPVDLREKLVIDCGKNSVASDTITLTRVTVQGKTTIKGKSLPLTANIIDSVFQSDFDLQTGVSASDNVTIEGTRFRKKVFVNLDGGDDLLTIRNTRCDKDASFNLAAGTNDRADVGMPRTSRPTPNSNGNTFAKTPIFAGVEVFL